VKVLLDTHAFLWWVADDPQLSTRARRIMGNSSNDVYFSAVSGWEIAIKVGLGRLRIGDESVEDFVAEHVAVNGFQVLAIQLGHTLGTASLPDHHSDPFDRLLVAQAISEKMALISADRALAEYKLKIVW
jgi:PIN domain nuclease of toxin-antitoxin system